MKTLVNILGAGRSGTTMLDLMLGNDDKSFSLGEVHAWFRPFRKHHFNIDCNCGDPKCLYWARVKDFQESEFHAKAFDALEVDFLIDSSKNLPWVMDSSRWAVKHKVKVVNFIIYKPVISYIYSIWKRGEGVQAALNRYKVYYRRFFQSGLDAYSVSFDELVSSTDMTLQKVTQISGQPNKVNRSEFWKKDHHHLFGSGGIRNQSQTGKSLIQSTENLPDSFVEMIPEFNKMIEADFELTKLIQQLNEKDLNNDERSLQTEFKLVKPIWYYYLKASNKLFNYFPDKKSPRH